MWLLSVLLLTASPSFDALTSEVGVKSTRELCEDAERWLSSHAGDPDEAAAALFLGQQYLILGDRDGARRAYERVRALAPGTETGRAATRALAELAMDGRDYSVAEARYAELASRPEGTWSYLGRNGLAEARRASARWTACWLALALLVAFNAARLMLIRRSAFRPLPPEVVYVLPLFVLFCRAALTQPLAEREAIFAVAFGGVTLVCCNAWYWRARPPAGQRRWLEPLLGLLQTAALVYSIIVFSGLWLKVVDTFAMGPE